MPNKKARNRWGKWPAGDNRSVQIKNGTSCMVPAGGAHKTGTTNRRATEPTKVSKDMHECFKHHASF